MHQAGHLLAEIDDVLVGAHRLTSHGSAGLDVPVDAEDVPRQQALHRVQDFLHGKGDGFGQDARQFVLEELADVFVDGVGGEEDPVDAGALAGDFGEKLDPVATWHGDVAEDHVPGLRQGHGEAFFAIACGGDFVAGTQQQVLQDLA